MDCNGKENDKKRDPFLFLIREGSGNIAKNLKEEKSSWKDYKPLFSILMLRL